MRSLLLILIAFIALGCSVYDPKLIQGGTGGTGGTGGSGGTGGTGECVETGRPENCDSIDDDCDMRLNNGNAAASCTEILNAMPSCSSSGECFLRNPETDCFPGFYNCDGNPGNGCESCEVCGLPCPEDAGSDDAGGEDASMELPDAAPDATTMPCVPTGAETCDGIDNDCNEAIDDTNVCPTGCTGHTEETGEVYVLCSSPLNWGGARAACVAAPLGMRLVRIDDEPENTNVRAFISSVLGAPATAWIGASDSTTEGVWRWTDDTQFWMGSVAGSAVGGLYTNWAGGQPDDAGGMEDCAQMTADGAWNDLPCGTAASQPFVCERP